MDIVGWTVCVGYSQELQACIEQQLEGLSKLVVVTTPDDHHTRDLCASYPGHVHRFATDVFYRNGAHFNKGLALDTATEQLGIGPDWNLLIDADIQPLKGWRAALEAQDLGSGNVYGMRRAQKKLPQIMLPDQQPAGYWMLWHCDDEHTAEKPLFTSWQHAGCFDSVFVERWPKRMQRWLDGYVFHLGEPGKNWCGVGRQDLMTEVMRERAKRGGWQHERVG